MKENSHADLAFEAAAIVDDQLGRAIRSIDRAFEEGYAKKNPHLVAAHVNAACLVLNTLETLDAQEGER